jgi:hypothetical protein
MLLFKVVVGTVVVVVGIIAVVVVIVGKAVVVNVVGKVEICCLTPEFLPGEAILRLPICLFSQHAFVGVTKVQAWQSKNIKSIKKGLF